MQIKLLAFALAATLSATAFSQVGILLQAYPTETVADGKSAITITLTVRNNNGSSVADGTQVLLRTTLGTFRETIVKTSSGVARAVLVPGSTSGVARITATLLQNQASPSQLDVEFVRSRSELASSFDFVEIASDTDVEYTYKKKLVTANSLAGKALFETPSIKIEAESLQYSYDENIVRAKQAVVTIRGKSYRVGQLYYDARKRTGAAIGEGEFTLFDRLIFQAGLFRLEILNDQTERFELAKKQRRIGTLLINKEGVFPTLGKVDTSQFEFRNIRDGIVPLLESEVPKENEEDFYAVRIRAKSVTFVNRKEAQFYDARFFLGEQKMFSQQMFRLDATGMMQNFPTEQYISINNNQFTMNYPYYLDLSRRQSTALRFRTGQAIGRGVNVNHGVFFDFEQMWTQGRNDGRFNISGIGREDFNIGARQFSRFGSDTSFAFSVDAPRAETLLSTASLSKTFKGAQLSLTSTAQKSIKKTPVQVNRHDTFLVVEKDPVKLGKMPWNLYYGLNANYSNTGTLVSQGVGARFRLQSNPFMTDKSGAALTAGIAVSQQSGTNILAPFATNANVTYTKSFGNRFSLNANYDFTQDGITEKALGSHRLTGYFLYSDPKFNANVFASNSIGGDRLNLFGDASFRMSSKWRLLYQYSVNRYDGTVYVDYNYVLAHRLREDKPEFGFIYSSITKRVGITLLGNASH
ncbi:MAG TPA: Ig-like domain-containing protein [Fimbriimonas sp.]|nr:Ig-like domain-containing protein [Fimbriimonas sp.]